MHFKLTRGMLIGDQWHEDGAIIQANGKYAENLVKSGAAVPVSPSAPEAAVAPKPPERATSARQR